MESGDQEIIWDGKDDVGHSLPSGVYLCEITIANKSQTKKMMLLR